MYTTDDTGKTSGWGDGGKEGGREDGSRFSHHSLLDPRVPESAAPECDLRPIRERPRLSRG